MFGARFFYTWAAGLTAAGGIVGDIANLFGQNKANRQQEQYNTDVMNQQRMWALQDFNMQNAYNAPAAQMARYKAAGLNPNLIYSQNATPSAAVRSTAAPSYSPGNTLQGFSRLGEQVGQSIMLGQDLQNKTQDLVNLKNTAMLQQADLLGKELANNITRTIPGATPEINDMEAFIKKYGDEAYRVEGYKFATAENIGEQEITKNNILNVEYRMKMQDLLQQQLMNPLSVTEMANNIKIQAQKMNLNDAQLKLVNTQMDNIMANTDIQKWELSYRKGDVNIGGMWRFALETVFEKGLGLLLPSR